MTDAVVLLALSQLVCLGGLAYLYSQVMKLRSGAMDRRDSSRVLPLDAAMEIGEPVPHADRVTRRPATPAQMDVGMVTKRMDELGLDIPALARRMNRSEDEIRLLLRRRRAA